MKTIGLTGGIGAGKSAVAQILEELGAEVIHADTVGHEIYRPNSEGWRRVIDAFGPDLLCGDQTIDRKKLGTIVFGDPQALRTLNAIVHPLMFDEIRHRIEAYRASGATRPIVLEAAVLIEANWFPLVDEVWLVVTSKAAVIERLHAERGLLREAVENRINAQLSDRERRRFAQVVIENTGSLDELRDRVRAAWVRATAGQG